MSYWSYVLLLTLACGSVESMSVPRAAPIVRPPFIILNSDFNELEDEMEIIGRNFDIGVIRDMTASSVTAGVSGGQMCLSDTPIAVSGNMDCLIAFWRRLDTSPLPETERYSTFISPESNRPECDYTIGYDECLSGYSSVDQKVTYDANAVIDCNPETVWAQPITPGEDTIIKIDLHGQYMVAALSMDVETVPLEVTISLATAGSPKRDVLRLQQEPCDEYSSSICHQYFSMDRKLLTLSWPAEDEELIADEVIITFHGVQDSVPYTTNYLIIRDIQFLAKAATTSLPPTTTTTTTTTTRTLRQRAKTMREILSKNSKKYIYKPTSGWVVVTQQQHSH